MSATSEQRARLAGGPGPLCRGVARRVPLFFTDELREPFGQWFRARVAPLPPRACIDAGTVANRSLSGTSAYRPRTDRARNQEAAMGTGPDPADGDGVEHDQPEVHTDAALSAADTEEFRDHRVVDEHAEEIGKVTDVIYDPATNRPTWLVVHTGLSHGDHYMPVSGTYRSENGDLVSPFDKHTVQHAPKANKDHVLARELESELRASYTLEGDEGVST